MARTWLHPSTEPIPTDKVFVAGMFAGAVMAALNCPIELLKVKMQVQDPMNRQYRSIFDCGRQILQMQGLRGLYRGMGITVLRDVPSLATYFSVYEIGKHLLHEGGDQMPGWKAIVCGGIAGLTAWLPCYPQDVIKSRIQGSPTPITILASIRHMMGTSGWRAFFRGFGPTMVRAFPANAATFYAYECARSFLDAQC